MARKPDVSPETKMWGIIESMKYKGELTDYDLANLAGVSERTVRSDRDNPGKIPLCRLLKYFSVIMTANQFVSMVETSISIDSKKG